MNKKVKYINCNQNQKTLYSKLNKINNNLINYNKIINNYKIKINKKKKFSLVLNLKMNRKLFNMKQRFKIQEKIYHYCKKKKFKIVVN